MYYVLSKIGILLVKKLALQSCHSNKNTFNTGVISAKDILQMQQYSHSLKHYITIAPCSIVPIILHKFHNSIGHQEPSVLSRPYKYLIGSLNYVKML